VLDGSLVLGSALDGSLVVFLRTMDATLELVRFRGSALIARAREARAARRSIVQLDRRRLASVTLTARRGQRRLREATFDTSVIYVIETVHIPTGKLLLRHEERITTIARSVQEIRASRTFTAGEKMRLASHGVIDISVYLAIGVRRDEPLAGGEEHITAIV
jgi:hypothetical protein